jgi:signal transduction histidine kinase
MMTKKLFHFKKNIVNDLLMALLFGLIAFIFGLIQFNIPGIEGGTSGLNEVPLLISVIYLSHPIYVLLVSFIFCFSTTADGSILSTFLMHGISLIPFWYYYHTLVKPRFKNVLVVVVLFIFGICFYYLVLVLPIMIITNQFVGLNILDFRIFYFQVLEAVYFEMFATSLIATLYLLHYNVNQQLKEHITSVESQVKERTSQLAFAVKELNAANEELKTVNNHLDEQVLERTQTLENRNIQLSGYAFVNSHLLRAPLARILGLASILKDESTSQSKENILMDKMIQSCDELDKIIHLMGKIVTEESILEVEQIEDLQEQIRKISNEISMRGKL